MELPLSDTLRQRIRTALGAAKPPTLYWDYRDELSPRQINKILESTEGIFEVERELLELNDDEVWRLEMESARMVLSDFTEEIGQELTLPEDNITPDLLDDLILEHDLLSYSPGIDSHIEQIVRNSHPKIVLQLALFHEHPGWCWKADVQYEDVQYALQLFKINPKSVHKDFPNLPYRNAQEYIRPKDMIELWENASYGGRYVMPLDLNLLDFHRKRRDYYHGVTLKKGSEIWLHDYINGSGSISVPLQKDLTILRKNLHYEFADDNDAIGYGLEEVYGLTRYAWENEIEPMISPTAADPSLPSFQQIGENFHYGDLYDSLPSSSRMRAFNDHISVQIGKAPSRDKMLEWEMDHSLWASFPKAGLRYLKEQADSEADYYIFKITERLDKTATTHCHLIVHYDTRKVEWYAVADSHRSAEIYAYFKAKIENGNFSLPTAA